MKKHLKGIVIILAVLFMASTASAAEQVVELEGTVTEINTISNTFVLKTDRGSVPINVRVMSRIIINGERKALAAVKSGSIANGTYQNWNGKAVVKEIVITDPK